MALVTGVCSNKVRPMVQNHRMGKSGQWWKRDPWHIRKSGTQTMCGIDSSEWINIGQLEIDDNCCGNCIKRKPHDR